MKPNVTAVVFACLIIFFTYICGIGIKNVFRYNTFKKELMFMLEKRDLLLAQNYRYARLLSTLEQNSSWEVLAKKKLGLAQKNEVVYTIIRN